MTALYTQMLLQELRNTLDGAIDRTFPLEEMWVTNLDEGIFYTDSQKVYFFVPILY